MSFVRVLSGCREKVTHGQGMGDLRSMEEQTGLEDFLDVIKDEVQELVESLEDTGHCDGIDHLEHLLVVRRGEVTACAPSRPPVNFTLIFSFMYLERSRIASRFGLSIVGCGPCGP